MRSWVKRKIREARPSDLSQSQDPHTEFQPESQIVDDHLVGLESVLLPVEDARITTEDDLRGKFNLDLLSKIPSVVGSAWYDEKRVLEGTRLDTFALVKSWLANEEQSAMWLRDGAGTGKSTFASELARMWQTEGILGGYFFFSLLDQRRRTLQYTWPTIASRLVSNYPYIHDDLSNAIKKNPNIVSDSPNHQLQQLVIGPLSKHAPYLHRSRPLVIIFDALDEMDANSREEFFASLPQFRAIRGLKIFITSRPEFTAGAKSTDFIVDGLEGKKFVEGSGDVQLYIRARLRRLVQPQQVNLVEELASNANILFIWASIVCDRILRSSNPSVTLRSFTKNPSPNDMNGLYTRVLQEAADGHGGQEPSKWLFIRVLRLVVTTREPLSCSTVASLLNLPGTRVGLEDVENVVEELGSLFLSSEPTQVLHLVHATLYTFLTTRPLGDPFFMDMTQAHDEHLRGSLHIMQRKLQRDIRGIGMTANLDENSPQQELSQYIPPDLAYASKYWPYHAHFVLDGQDTPVEILAILKIKALEWIEAVATLDHITPTMESFKVLQARSAGFVGFHFASFTIPLIIALIARTIALVQRTVTFCPVLHPYSFSLSTSCSYHSTPLRSQGILVSHPLCRSFAWPTRSRCWP